MWVWLKLELTLIGDHTKADITASFVNFFMHSPKRSIPEWANILTFSPKHPKREQNLQLQS